MHNLTGLNRMPGITSTRIAIWLEAGYGLFINEGQHGINVERLARVLGRNKSAFYHFFGDRETFMEFLLAYHMTKVDAFVDDIKIIDQYDPQFIDLLIKHHRVILFNSQLIKNCHHKLCDNALREINLRIDEYVLPLWSKHVGLEYDLDLSKRYHAIIRDYMYIKVTTGSFNYDFFSALASEAKLIITGLTYYERSTQTSKLIA